MDRSEFIKRVNRADNSEYILEASLDANEWLDFFAGRTEALSATTIDLGDQGELSFAIGLEDTDSEDSKDVVGYIDILHRRTSDSSPSMIGTIKRTSDEAEVSHICSWVDIDGLPLNDSPDVLTKIDPRYDAIIEILQLAEDRVNADKRGQNYLSPTDKILE